MWWNFTSGTHQMFHLKMGSFSGKISIPPPTPPTFPDVEAQWCSQGDLLAVAGMERHGLPSDAGVTRNALVKFYNVHGEHIYTLETPAQVPKLEKYRRGKRLPEFGYNSRFHNCNVHISM